MAERRGLEHFRNVLQSGHDLTPISRDDSDLDDDEMLGDNEALDADSCNDVGNICTAVAEMQVCLGAIPISKLTAKTQTEAPDTPLPNSDAITTNMSSELARPNSTLPEDPFQYTPEKSTSASLPSPTDVHGHKVVYLIYLLVFWLHAQCHLPFRACNAVLVCFAIILRSAGVVVEPPMVATLPTVMTALHADPSFRICPVCPTCQKVYPPSVLTSATCCLKPLFITAPTPSEQRRGQNNREKPKPCLQFPYKSLEEQLATMLANPGVEEEIERSIDRVKSSVNGVYTNIFDGKVCKELPCQDGSLFFSPSENVRASGELRVGVSLGVDWYVGCYFAYLSLTSGLLSGFLISVAR